MIGIQRILPRLSLAGLLALPVLLWATPMQAHGVTRYDNGRWFDGAAFKPGAYFSIDGRLELEYAGEVDSVVDLQEGFVISPLADAHTHALGDARFPQAQTEFLAAGIFYAANPNSLRNQTDPIRAAARKPETVDVIYANGGLTSSGGHPIQIYDRAADHTPGVERAEMAEQAYFAIDAASDLERAWPQILEGQPDFIKVYLEQAENHEARKDDDGFYGRRGLDPALLPLIVEKAHRGGLRVAVHVASQFDFRIAVQAGADEIAHLPLERLDEETARLAAQRGTTVVTTTLSHRPSQVKDLTEVHRFNLDLLSRNGVRLVLGTDSDRGLLTELRNVAQLMALSNEDAVKLATQTTPRWIFPDRKIGSLEPGYEATFLVLGADPLADLSAFEQIRLRVKAGHTLEAEARSERPSIGQALMHTLMSSGPDAAIEEYRRLRSESPDDYDFSEPQLNALGYALIQHDQLDAAIAIFELNVEMFPDGFNAYDSLGEALMAAGQREESIRNYRKSLELNPENRNAREKLQELGQPSRGLEEHSP